MRRHEISESEWSRIQGLLPLERDRPGRPSELSNRLFMNAVIYIAKTGIQWRDLPERFGPWKTVHSRFSRWNKQGVFEQCSMGWPRTRTTNQVSPTRVALGSTSTELVEKGGPNSMYWTLSRRPYNEDPRSR